VAKKLVRKKRSTGRFTPLAQRYPENEFEIELTGRTCDRCGHPVRVEHGQWPVYRIYCACKSVLRKHCPPALLANWPHSSRPQWAEGIEIDGEIRYTEDSEDF